MLLLMLEERLDGVEVGEEIRVGDDGALRRAGGAGGVLEEGDLVFVL